MYQCPCASVVVTLRQRGWSECYSVLQWVSDFAEEDLWSERDRLRRVGQEFGTVANNVMVALLCCGITGQVCM